MHFIITFLLKIDFDKSLNSYEDGENQTFIFKSSNK